MNRRNYQQELDALLRELTAVGRVPRLLLHSCCAPCSSYVLSYLSDYFSITDVYYNPNIEPEEEYEKRAEELKRLIAQMPFAHPVTFVCAPYDPKPFHEAVRGLEHIPEGGARCFACYRLRLEDAARRAATGGYDYFTTTLSISPMKNVQKLNEIGEEMARRFGVKHLPCDFKKKNGYLCSTRLSEEYHLYRQDYCGCIYSQMERDMRKKDKQENLVQVTIQQVEAFTAETVRK